MTWKKTILTMPNPRQKELEELLRPYATVVTYPAKKVFLEPGTNLDCVYYVAEGRTSHYMVAMDGTKKILYTLAAGWFYGETPCNLQEPTGLYSKTETKTTVYQIPLSTYEHLLDTNKMFRDAILESYSKKMLTMRHEIENLTFHSCKDRLKRLLCSVADTSRVEDGGWYGLKVHYTQYELSTIVGGARVTISKLLNELCAEGFMRMVNRSIQINVAAFQRFSRWSEETE